MNEMRFYYASFMKRVWILIPETKSLKGIYIYILYTYIYCKYTWEKITEWDIKCLDFADDLGILTNNREGAKDALENLHEIARKQVSKSHMKKHYMERCLPDKHDTEKFYEYHILSI